MHPTTEERPEVTFLTTGPVTEAEKDSAARAVRGALEGARGTVRSARLTLSVVSGDELPRPALVQAVVDIDGERLRAQAAAPTLTEAIGVLRKRLSVRTSHRRAG